MTRQDVDHNRPFPGALPAVTFGSKRVAVNVTYMPEVVVDRVTNAKLRDPDMDGVFFIQLKLDASLFGFGGGRRQMLAAADQKLNKNNTIARSRTPVRLRCDLFVHESAPVRTSYAIFPRTSSPRT